MAEKLSAATKERLLDKFSHAAASVSGRVHVIPSREGWAVKKEGVKRASSVQATKAAAVRAANQLKAADTIVVHNENGTVKLTLKVQR